MKKTHLHQKPVFLVLATSLTIAPILHIWTKYLKKSTLVKAQHSSDYSIQVYQHHCLDTLIIWNFALKHHQLHQLHYHQSISFSSSSSFSLRSLHLANCTRGTTYPVFLSSLLCRAVAVSHMVQGIRAERTEQFLFNVTEEPLCCIVCHTDLLLRTVDRVSFGLPG